MSRERIFKQQSQKVNPIFKLLKKKIADIRELEREYWDEIRRRRAYLSEATPTINESLEAFFPSNVSSRIYACLDGVVLLRFMISNQESKFEIFNFNETLAVFLDHLPIPTESGDINLSPFVKLGVGSDLKIISCEFSEVLVEWLWINCFLYSDDKRVARIEEALTDFKMYVLGFSIDPNLRPLGNRIVEAEDILGKLECIINEFDNLLNRAPKEEQVQQFLKEHTILIQAYTDRIPKQRLGEDWVTDFVLVNMLDQGPKYTFVEIEKPSMPILNRCMEFTAEFKHAEKQILDWDIWLQDNQDYVQRKLKNFEAPAYLIIGGRSKDLGEKEKRYIRAWNRSQKSTAFLTYDDLLLKAKELLETLKRDVC